MLRMESVKVAVYVFDACTHRADIPTMGNGLWAPGREVLYVRSHTKKLADDTIVGPSDEGDDCVALRCVRGGRESTNSAAPRHAVPCQVSIPMQGSVSIWVSSSITRAIP